MSGFEVAGIVLGALPLLLYAIDHYSEGASTVRDMLEYKDGFRRLCIVFDAIWMTYTGACERLLLQIHIPLAACRELIKSPSSKKWEDKELQEKIKIRLGRSYNPYKDLVSELMAKVEKLRKKLKLNEDYLPPWVVLEGTERRVLVAECTKFFKSKRNRIRGGLDLKACARHIDRIRRDVESISNIIKDEADLEGLRMKRQQQCDLDHWLRIRSNAERIFGNLESRWSRPCACQNKHRASIQLDRTEADWNGTADEVSLRFIMSLDQKTSGSSSIQGICREVDITSQQVAKISVPAVRFATAGATSHSSSPQTPSRLHGASTTSKTQLQSPSLPGNNKITDLCQALEANHPSSSLGWLEDQQWQHHIADTDPSHNGSLPYEINSFQGLMNSNGRSFGDLSLKEKRSLALKMALAVLQLHDTPWVDVSFHTNDLTFCTRTPVDSATLLAPAYISHAFNSGKMTQAQGHNESKGRELARNGLVYALGIALVELSHNSILLNKAVPSELDAHGNATPETEMRIAARLVKDVRNRDGENYAWATVSCIECDMGYPFNYSLNDEEFKARFIERVVLPLKEDYDEIFSKR